MTRVNRQILLTQRPIAAPTADMFVKSEQKMPDLSEGEFLLRICLLSMDPALVGRMREESNYVDSVPLNSVMHAYGIGQVIETKNDQVKLGELRFGRIDMQEYVILSDPNETPVINLGLASPQEYLCSVGIAGATAYFSLPDIGKPTKGETILISAGASAVARVVVQMAKQLGLVTVGIVSTADKAQQTKSELPYDSVISYRGKSIDELSTDIAKACPNGADIYYDNTSGDISESVMDHFNDFGRHIVIGRLAISHLADTRLDTGRRDNNLILSKRLIKQGFVLLDYKPVFKAAYLQLAKWVKNGLIISKIDTAQGIDQVVPAFFRMLAGESEGKQLVKLSDIDDSVDPTSRTHPKVLIGKYFPTT